MKYAEYIKKIEIDSLWSGRKHIVWNLDRQVNILSGVNGVGKSTILNKLIAPLKFPNKGEIPHGNGVKIETVPEDATHIRFDVIRSIDRPLINAEIASQLDFKVATELDLQIYTLQRRYLDYQVNIANRMIEALQNGNAPEAQRLSAVKTKFQDMIIRTANEIRFLQIGEELTPYQLSSGEKQMLVILLTVLVEDNKPYLLLMDEPEVSLHIDWQQQLIELITTLNPNAQIILTTHSPALIMNGWMDSVTEVNEIEV